MVARGENAQAVDTAVKVDDRPALLGLAAINAEITAAVGALGTERSPWPWTGHLP